MVLITAGVAASDEEAALVIQKRREHKDKSIAMNFALVQGIDLENMVVSSIHFAHSSPGGSAALHAERNAFSKLCDEVGATFDQNDGAATARSLRSKKIKHIPKLYSELPPCPSCKIWLTNFANQNVYDVAIKYAEELEGYFELPNKFQKDKLFHAYINEVIKD